MSWNIQAAGHPSDAIAIVKAAVAYPSNGNQSQINMAKAAILEELEAVNGTHFSVVVEASGHSDTRGYRSLNISVRVFPARPSEV